MDSEGGTAVALAGEEKELVKVEPVSSSQGNVAVSTTLSDVPVAEAEGRSLQAAVGTSDVPVLATASCSTPTEAERGKDVVEDEYESESDLDPDDVACSRRFELLCSEAENTSLRSVSDIEVMDEVAVMGLRTYLLEVENIRRAKVRSRIFLQMLGKYRRYRERCRRLHEHLRNDPCNRALGEELVRRDQQLLQALGSKSALEEQIRRKDEELEVGKGIAAECAHLQGKLREMELEAEQNRVKAAEAAAEWSGKLAALEGEVAALKFLERGASSRAGALEAAIRVHESRLESERETATLKEARLEEWIAVLEQEAQVMLDRIAALEEENRRLQSQAGSSHTAVSHQAHELWVYAEAQRDVYKNLLEAGIVTETVFEVARQKAREARADCGYDVATPEADNGASGGDGDGGGSAE
ncbi:PREDICTED: uncharacterized abhydrolase domain-containing protein DDB_G0269086-like [Nicotiana attenuata]|uniref:uncharacterized abhydrolase domain-containing protein DDB_G0269086-like n=1 Tax=Nicotiana attenuata TaxID=49451 RepID=UPI000904F678|nr:PREDICTED: uncharacterized abhydrolase domain-containing protein DDB_G0269086-like [Nicotiana attenuata]